MIINLVAKYPKELAISPDPAVVRLGERVSWSLKFENRSRFPKSVTWTIYFRLKHPFGPETDCSWTHRAESNGDTVDAGETRERGEYKYGVRLTDAESNETISDDDPVLTVV
jgi:hypothetical protein